MEPTIRKRKFQFREGHGLFFSQSLSANENCFSEFPLVQDTCTREEAKNKESPAWNIVRQFLPSQTKLELTYAKGILSTTNTWEPADQVILDQLAIEFNLKKEKILELYDIVATNMRTYQLLRLTIFPKDVETIKRSGIHVPELETIPSEGVVLEATSHFGFFKLLSFANHSCNPSCQLIHPTTDLLPVFVRTKRQVQINEELTIDYLQNESPETKRWKLKEKFGFCCECTTCITLCYVLSCPKHGKYRCGRCHLVRYCSRQHQREDWYQHRLMCCT